MATVRARARRIRAALAPGEWGRVGGMAGTVVGLHVLGWGMLAAALSGHYHISKTEIFGLGTGFLAYTLGMRHAFDADHIAAIDNTTRKLVGEGKRPLSVGFFFSLGHSSVVFVLAVLLNFGIRSLDTQVRASNSALQHVTSVVGTLVSATFLFLIAALNAVILVGLLRFIRELRSGAYSDTELDEQLDKRGLMMRFPARSPARWTRRGGCTPSASCSAWASTRRPRWPCWCWRARRWSAGCPSTRSCRCPSCSRPA